MVKRSLILNMVHFIRTLFSAATDITLFYTMWFVIKWICLNTDFEFISATVGFFIGVGMLVLNSVTRAIRYKYFGLLVSRMIVVFVFAVFGNTLYQKLAGIKTDMVTMRSYFIVLCVAIAVFTLIGRLLDRVVVSSISKVFEEHEDDFELVKDVTYYYMGGGIDSRSCVYRLKTMNVYNIEVEHGVSIDKK